MILRFSTVGTNQNSISLKRKMVVYYVVQNKGVASVMNVFVITKDILILKTFVLGVLMVNMRRLY